MEQGFQRLYLCFPRANLGSNDSRGAVNLVRLRIDIRQGAVRELSVAWD